MSLRFLSINLSAATDVLAICIHLSSKVENCWQENIKKETIR